MYAGSWEQNTRTLSDEEITDFYDKPLEEINVFHYQTKKFEVPSHGGAFSIKCTLSGTENYCFNSRSVPLKQGQYLVTNQDCIYSSQVHNQTESLSFYLPQIDLIHLLCLMNKTCVQLLDDPFEHQPVTFASVAKEFDRNVWIKLKKLSNWIKQIRSFPELLFIDLMTSLLADGQHIYHHTKLQHIRSRTTRKELIKRITQSIEYIEDQQGQLCNLEELAMVACLSKYHYLRVFKDIMHMTPVDYARKKRLQVALQKIKAGKNLKAAITEAGYTDKKSFKRALKRADLFEI